MPNTPDSNEPNIPTNILPEAGAAGAAGTEGARLAPNPPALSPAQSLVNALTNALRAPQWANLPCFRLAKPTKEARPYFEAERYAAGGKANLSRDGALTGKQVAKALERYPDARIAVYPALMGIFIADCDWANGGSWAEAQNQVCEAIYGETKPADWQGNQGRGNAVWLAHDDAAGFCDVIEQNGTAVRTSKIKVANWKRIYNPLAFLIAMEEETGPRFTKAQILQMFPLKGEVPQPTENATPPEAPPAPESPEKGEMAQLLSNMRRKHPDDLGTKHFKAHWEAAPEGYRYDTIRASANAMTVLFKEGEITQEELAQAAYEAAEFYASVEPKEAAMRREKIRILFATAKTGKPKEKPTPVMGRKRFWETPTPLQKIIPQPADFPTDSLCMLADFTRAIYHSGETPMPGCALAVLAAVSGAAQGLFDVETSHPKPLYLSLYTLYEALPGMGKSTLYRSTALKPYVDFSEEKDLEHQQALKAYHQNQKRAKSGAIKNAAEVLAQMPPRRHSPSLQDFSAEALMRILAHETFSVVWASDEANSVIHSYSHQDGKRADLIGKLAHLFSSGHLQRMRRGPAGSGGISESAHGARITIWLATQAGGIAKFCMTPADIESGFAHRFLTCRQLTVLDKPTEAQMAKMQPFLDSYCEIGREMYNDVYEKSQQQEQHHEVPQARNKLVTSDPVAYQILNNFQKECQEMAKRGLIKGDMLSLVHGGMFRVGEMAWKIAGLLAVFRFYHDKQHMDPSGDTVPVINEREAIGACNLAWWFFMERIAIALSAQATDKIEQAGATASALLEDLKAYESEKLAPSIAKNFREGRQVRLKTWRTNRHIRGSKKNIEDEINTLKDKNIIQLAEGGRGWYEIHPEFNEETIASGYSYEETREAEPTSSPKRPPDPPVPF